MENETTHTIANIIQKFFPVVVTVKNFNVLISIWSELDHLVLPNTLRGYWVEAMGKYKLMAPMYTNIGKHYQLHGTLQN